MARPLTFQVHPRDWLGSPSVNTMTPAEAGAYFRLLCYAWISVDGGIPADDNALAWMSRMGPERWGQSKEKILANFNEKHGRLYNRQWDFALNLTVDLQEPHQ